MGRLHESRKDLLADVAQAATDPVKVRDEMLARINQQFQEEREEWNRVMHNEPAHAAVKEALRATTKRSGAKKDKEVESRKLKRFNSLLTMKLVYHLPDGSEKVSLLEMQDSTYLNELSKLTALVLAEI